MFEGMGRMIGVQVIRYVIGTQAIGVVVFHGAWMLLAMATWNHASTGEGGIGAVTHALTRGFAWLGGVDADGHGDAGNLMTVWGALSLVVYAVDALFRRCFGEWPPVRLWVVTLGSGAVAVAGWLLAFWPTLDAGSDIGGTVLLVALFSLLAALGTLWAVLARRVGDYIIQLIERDNSRAPLPERV